MKQQNKHIVNLILQSQGIDVSKYDETFFYKSLQKRITETKCGSDEDYYNFLKLNETEGSFLIDSLQISYSEFFRNTLTFAVLERIVLPVLIKKKIENNSKEIRIWSAACAAGQETYSLAILLKELKAHNNENINYRIFATDQSQQQINEALKGVYNASALNSLNLKRMNKWFTFKGDSYTIKPALKKNIYFSVFDLFSQQYSSPPESIFGNFDIVICANLLFYYKNEYRSIIIDKVKNSMAKNGYLMTGEAERDILMKNGFKEVILQSAIFQGKC